MGIAVVSSVAVAQSSAGTTAAVSAPGAGLRIVMHGADVTIDGTGTLKFTDGTVDLTGPFTAHGSQGKLMNIAGGHDCVLRCGENRPLNIVTTNHAANGVVYYTIESV
jgi:hypothetical protein